MEILKFDDYDSEEYLKRVYTLSDNVQVDNFSSVVKSFENTETKMTVCNCQSFDENGHPMYRTYSSSEEIAQASEFSNPYIRFYAEFCDIKTEAYKFNLEANVNSNIVAYIVDKKKLTADTRRSRSR